MSGSVRAAGRLARMQARKFSPCVAHMDRLPIGGIPPARPPAAGNASRAGDPPEMRGRAGGEGARPRIPGRFSRPGAHRAYGRRQGAARSRAEGAAGGGPSTASPTKYENESSRIVSVHVAVPMPRPVSSGWLSTRLAARSIHHRPINAVFCCRPWPYGGASCLGMGFVLRCFQRLAQMA